MSDAPSVDLLAAFENAFPDTGFVLDETGEIVRTFVGPEIDVLLVEEIDDAVGRSVEDVFNERTARNLREHLVGSGIGLVTAGWGSAATYYLSAGAAALGGSVGFIAGDKIDDPHCPECEQPIALGF